MIVQAEVVHSEPPLPVDTESGRTKTIHRGIDCLTDIELTNEYHWARGSHNSRGEPYLINGQQALFKTPNSLHARACEGEMIMRGLSTL